VVFYRCRYEIGRHSAERWKSWNKNLQLLSSHSEIPNVVAANNLYDLVGKIPFFVVLFILLFLFLGILFLFLSLLPFLSRIGISKILHWYFYSGISS
jgi:hypothetical protein